MKLVEVSFVVAMLFCGMVAFYEYKYDYINLMLSKDDLQPKSNSLVLIPTFTANAYKDGSFYDYFHGRCDESCLQTTISYVKLEESGSENTSRTLERLGYNTMSDFIADYYLRSDPDWLESYHTIIVLHNEYVTQRLFDALQKHNHVIYLAPNSSYALIDVDGPTMKLIAGHSYMGKNNAFDWEFDNSNLEYNKECKDWQFKPIRNGYQLNCNPELIIHTNKEILKALKDL